MSPTKSGLPRSLNRARPGWGQTGRGESDRVGSCRVVRETRRAASPKNISSSCGVKIVVSCITGQRAGHL
eukprot:1493921-Prymnesium_polylepis.1